MIMDTSSSKPTEVMRLENVSVEADGLKSRDAIAAYQQYTPEELAAIEGSVGRALQH